MPGFNKDCLFQTKETTVNAPPEITKAISQILANGILRIRVLANKGDLQGVLEEADHIHNLPSMLADFKIEMLKFYLDTERAAYIKCGLRSEANDKAWQALDQWVD